MLGLPDEFPRWALERPAKPKHHVEARIALAALYEADVGRVALRLLGQLLVRQLRVLAEPPEDVAK